MSVDAHPFIDPVSGREMAVHFGEAPGIEHPDCAYRAEVMPELDAFFCRYCQWNGRISGAWFMDLLTARNDGDRRCVQCGESIEDDICKEHQCVQHHDGSPDV